MNWINVNDRLPEVNEVAGKTGKLLVEIINGAKHDAFMKTDGTWIDFYSKEILTRVNKWLEESSEM